ncbi:heme exporter protein CcmD [Maritimibacter dapengensis]|uniref:Heme exporter protein D n=1 Tax=Maritimibacter dapengensis TaxID=2836868 RepID=A0ABS6SZR9_9RHOB|nr:heme exporter protein CcmD [Maritimibacter dapengensis]MBV7378471.1 heme exporter protein CcmD [Maritimibacter dapengensis]
MLELGKYAGAVLSSWGVTLGLIGLLVAVSWVQARRVKAALDAAEARRKGGA